MPKRVFDFRYIESLGQENHGCPADKPFEMICLPDGKNRLSWAIKMSNFRGLISVGYFFISFITSTLNVIKNRQRCLQKSTKLKADI